MSTNLLRAITRNPAEFKKLRVIARKVLTNFPGYPKNIHYLVSSNNSHSDELF